MKGIELAAVQERFADIVWANEPISSGDLVKVCKKELSWKKPIVIVYPKAAGGLF